MTALRSTEPVLVLIENVNAPGRYLCEFNANWRAVMFPVSQPREFRDDRWGVAIDESPVDAAGRTVCEATGQLTGKSMLESLGDLHVTGLSQSGGGVTSYNFTLFRLRVDDNWKVQSTQSYWLTPEEIVDPDLMPVSPIARRIAEALLERELNG